MIIVTLQQSLPEAPRSLLKATQHAVCTPHSPCRDQLRYAKTPAPQHNPTRPHAPPSNVAENRIWEH